jgi:hypothetical protein
MPNNLLDHNRTLSLARNGSHEIDYEHCAEVPHCASSGWESRQLLIHNNGKVRSLTDGNAP